MPRVRIIPPESHEKPKPHPAHGMRVFLDEIEMREVTNIVVNYPVQGAVQVTLTFLVSGKIESTLPHSTAENLAGESRWDDSTPNGEHR